MRGFTLRKLYIYMFVLGDLSDSSLSEVLVLEVKMLEAG